MRPVSALQNALKALLLEAVSRMITLQKEHRRRRGYKARPVRGGEFDDWTPEQAWP